MSRRGNREGTVYRTGDGRWRAEVTWVDRHGRRQRSTASRRTEADARKALRVLVRQVADELAPPVGTLTVEQYWRRWREGALLTGDRKASTVELYRVAMRVHVLPLLGGVRLSRLSAGDIEEALAAMTLKRATGGRPVGAPVSGQTRRTAFAVLSLMLATAVRDGVIPASPCQDLTRPAGDTAEAEYLSAEQLRAVLHAVAGNRLEPLVELLGSTGMRVGEALALRWGDVDLGEHRVRVTGTVRTVGGVAQRTAPKSLRSRRTLPLPASAEAALRRWRRVQSAERLRAGTAWHSDGTAWVFTTDSGRLLDQRNAARAYRRALDAAGLVGTPARFHMLRHSVASLMLADGAVSLRVAAEILGHSSTRLTADTYAHVAQEHKTAALDVVARALG